MDSFLVVFSPLTKGPEIYQQKVLPFGSVASVTAFLRVALALWKVGTKLLFLLWPSYFDDFFSVAEQATSKHTDLVISAFFAILGWNLSSDKLVPFDSVCKVLGVKFDLKLSGDGLAFVLNTDERVIELCDCLDEVLTSKRLRSGEGEKLRGRLIFAAGQLFGRFARNQVRHLSNHIRSGRANLTEATVDALKGIRNYPHANVPRKIVGYSCEHIHLYVDASFDYDGYSGIGAPYTTAQALPLPSLVKPWTENFWTWFAPKVK